MESGASSRRYPGRISVELLAPDHFHVFVRAIRNIISTEIAELTFAQLIDGLPLASVGWDAQGRLITIYHPLNAHKTLCDGALDQIKEFCKGFNPSTLRLNSSVVQSYQNSTPGSIEFTMRLIELISNAIHQIGVFLFKSEPKLHNGDIDSILTWEDEPPKWITIEGHRVIKQPYFPPKPTLFFQINYLDFDQYPDGLADVAGYWTEDRIFGGVVLFDRGESGRECKDVYFHSGRYRTTFRIWRLLESQFNGFVDFLMSDQPTQPPPFPILATNLNLHRHDPWDAIALHHIFRDPWERKFPLTRPKETRCTRHSGDYPELESMFKALDAVPLPAHLQENQPSLVSEMPDSSQQEVLTSLSSDKVDVEGTSSSECTRDALLVQSGDESTSTEDTQGDEEKKTSENSDSPEAS